MKLVTRRIQILALTCALSLACAAPASANLLDVMAQDYVEDQQLDPCKYTEKELRTLKDLIPNDLAAYDAGFVPAVDDALARNAAGACKKGGIKRDETIAPPAAGGVLPPPPPTSGGPAPGPVEPAPAAPAPTPKAQPTAAPDVAKTDVIGLAARTTDPATEAPFPILALAVLAGLLALSGLLVAVVQWRAWEPAWVDRFRHAAGEAGWRASSTWAEFTDFVRFGR